MKKINGRMRVGKGVIKGVGGWRVGKWVIKEVGGHGERDYTGDAKGRVGKGMIKGRGRWGKWIPDIYFPSVFCHLASRSI